MAITGDNTPYIWTVSGVDIDRYMYNDDIDLNAVVRFYLIVAWIMGLIGVALLAVLYLVGQMSEEEDIIKVFNAWQTGVSAALTAQAEEIARLTAGSILDDMDRMKRTKYTKAFVDGVTDNITTDYTKYMKKGGSICVEPKYTKIAPGRVRATTEARFIPWLNAGSCRK